VKKKSILLILAICVVIGVGCFVWQKYQAAEVKSGGDSIITVFGNVDIRQVDLAFRVAGRVQKVLFEEGSAVKAGDLMATLDSKPFEEDLALQNAQLSAAQAGFELLKAGFRPQEIKVAQAAVAECQAVVNNVEKELARSEALVENGGVTRQSYDDIKSQKDEAAARLDSVKEQLALVKEGYRKQDIAKASAQVEAQKAMVRIAQIHLDDTKLLAPSDGTILTRVLEPGSIAGAGRTVLNLSISDPAWVRSYIDETDLGYVAPGMKVEVYTDSRPNKPYKGHVGFISPKAEFTPKNVETPKLRTRLVYRFRVIVDSPDGDLRQGMPVTVKLIPKDKDSGESTK
jgi:HlyD family secretion protein